MTNNKDLFMKWIQNLFYVQCIAMAGTIIGLLPFADGWFGWVNRAIALASIYVLYRLIPTNARYQKAVIYSGIAVALGLVVNWIQIFALPLIVSICSLIGLYQEFSAHSEMMSGIDDKLARKWHSLLNWNILSSIVVGFLGSALVVVGVLLKIDTNVLVILELVLIVGIELIIKLVYLIYLKRMLTAYANYEPQTEEMTSEEI